MIIRPKHIPVLSEKIESLGEMLVFLKFASHADENTGISFPTTSDIIESTGLTRGYIQKCIRKLIQKGLIVNEGRCKKNWRNKRRKVVISENYHVSYGDTVSQESTVSSGDTVIGTISIYSFSIAEIYKSYPKRVAPRDAHKSIGRALKELAGREGIDDPSVWLIDRVKKFAASKVGRGDFCPAPAKWFDGGRYDDDEKEWGYKESLVTKDYDGVI